MNRLIPIVVSAGLTGCVQINAEPTTTSSLGPQLSPGMSRLQVVHVLGQPSSVITERGNVECMNYVVRTAKLTGPSAFASVTTGHERVVVMRNGHLVQHQIIDTGFGTVAASADTLTSAKLCADVAGRSGR